jgi:hypothetical protein
VRVHTHTQETSMDIQDSQPQLGDHLPWWYKRFSVLSEDLPEDGPVGPEHVEAKKQKYKALKLNVHLLVFAIVFMS